MKKHTIDTPKGWRYKREPIYLAMMIKKYDSTLFVAVGVDSETKGWMAMVDRPYVDGDAYILEAPRTFTKGKRLTALIAARLAIDYYAEQKLNIKSKGRWEPMPDVPETRQ